MRSNKGNCFDFISLTLASVDFEGEKFEVPFPLSFHSIAFLDAEIPDFPRVTVHFKDD